MRELDLNKTEIVSANEVAELDWGLKAIKADQAWNLTKGKGVKVAVIDTGIDSFHPEFATSLKTGMNMFEKSFDITDEYGHGTHVAGLIAGKNTGVAPEAELYIAKVLNGEGEGSVRSVVDGITFAMNYEVDILCMSLGTHAELPLLVQQRIIDAHASGIVIVAATGNDSVNYARQPASMDEVIAVGGFDQDFVLADFSNRGENVLAPAVRVLSAYKDGKYARMTGTSMASPIVAGGIALLISHYRQRGIDLTPMQVKELLDKSVFDLEYLLELDN